MAVIVAALMYWSPGAQEADAGERAGGRASFVAVASANLNFERTNHDALLAWPTGDAAPDILALHEFTESARAAVTCPAVLAVFAHQLLAPSADQFGLAILSRHPIVSSQWVSPKSPLATLKLRTVIKVDGHPLAVTAVHPMPPISADYARERDASLRKGAVQLVASGIPGALEGDMNDSPWSSGLRVTALLVSATGLTPTWPNAGGWLSALPLDHVLVTPDIRVKSGATAPDLGSDHRPVVAKLLMPAFGAGSLKALTP